MSSQPCDEPLYYHNLFLFFLELDKRRWILDTEKGGIVVLIKNFRK
jgi:hypothetical protein